MKFPPIITPLKNGTFIFYPRWTLENYVHVRNPIDTMEYWKISPNFIRMPLELPFNLTENLEYLWIFKLWLFRKKINRYFYSRFRIMILRRGSKDTPKISKFFRQGFEHFVQLFELFSTPRVYKLIQRVWIKIHQRLKGTQSFPSFRIFIIRSCIGFK